MLELAESQSNDSKYVQSMSTIYQYTTKYYKYVKKKYLRFKGKFYDDHSRN